MRELRKANEILKLASAFFAQAAASVVEARSQHDSKWVAIAAKIGCTAVTLRRWVRQHDANHAQAYQSGSRS